MCIRDSLKIQGAPITVWGVGTKVVTASDQPALGGVYKLAALRTPDGQWDYKIKLSEQAIKINTPGIQQVRRYKEPKGFIADMIYNIEMPPAEHPLMTDPLDFTKRRSFEDDSNYEDLLVDIYKEGTFVYTLPSITKIKERVKEQLANLHEGSKRFANPHLYPVGLEEQLFDLKTDLILQLRNENQSK
jgi:nicotinate phosphoribosyltransferase